MEPKSHTEAKYEPQIRDAIAEEDAEAMTACAVRIRSPAGPSGLQGFHGWRKNNGRSAMRIA